MSGSRLLERESQVLTVTQDQRDELDETNPIVFAETAPNRFQTITYFFPEGDGVRIQEDLDLTLITIYYFGEDKGDEEIELTSGPLFKWALDLYNND